MKPRWKTIMIFRFKEEEVTEEICSDKHEAQFKYVTRVATAAQIILIQYIHKYREQEIHLDFEGDFAVEIGLLFKKSCDFLIQQLKVKDVQGRSVIEKVMNDDLTEQQIFEMIHKSLKNQKARNNGQSFT